MRLIRQLVVIALAITGTVAVAAHPAFATSNDYALLEEVEWIGAQSQFQIVGDGYNPGQVWVGFGTIYTPLNNCFGNATTNSYIQTYDWISGVWSHRPYPVEVC
jgi:hypothetical protein